MLPDIKTAQHILEEAWQCNPGPWAEHSRVAARCAKAIAEQISACGSGPAFCGSGPASSSPASCGSMDPEKAYILGLLHDIGRKFGARHLGHVYDGWRYMTELGYDEAARICLTHSFNNKTLKDYIGNFDISKEEQAELQTALDGLEYDDYDRLIQLCDSLADAAEGVVDIEMRMEDVKRRYGRYPEEKWNQNIALKEAVERCTGRSIYEIAGSGKPALRIRTATMEDLDDITYLESICFPAAEAAGKESFQKRLEKFSEHFWLLFEDDELVGMVNGMVTDEKTIRDEMFEDASLHQEDGAWQSIFGLDVLPSRQRQGYAARLMEGCIAEAKRQGKKGCILTCKDRLIHYYAKFGYQNFGVSASVHGGAVWYDMILSFEQ